MDLTSPAARKIVKRLDAAFLAWHISPGHTADREKFSRAVARIEQAAARENIDVYALFGASERKALIASTVARRERGGC